jgi:tripartite-type tricarboxylate transporter receptor subunit TctC
MGNSKARRRSKIAQSVSGIAEPEMGIEMVRSAVIVLTLLLLPGPTRAQEDVSPWPVRPVTFIVPNLAGSATDVLARVLARSLSERLGRAFIIETRPGADGTLGTRQAVKAASDGYTFLFSPPTALSAAPYFYASLPYDPTKDLVPVAMVGRTPYAFAVYPGLGVNNMLELVALAKSKPGQLNYSSSGEGSIAHLGMAVFTDKVGIDVRHIPYKSTAQSIVDVATGIIQMQLATIPPILSLYAAKKIGVLAVAYKNRLPVLPDVPTVAEAGIPDYEESFWVAVFAPVGTPAPIVARLNQEIGAAVQSDEVKKAFAQQASETEHSTPDGLAKILQDDIQAYREIATKVGMPRH